MNTIDDTKQQLDDLLIPDLERIVTQYTQDDEVLTRENKNRFVLFPICYQAIWAMYKKHKNAFWTAEEIDLSKDLVDFRKLDLDEQHFIKMTLAFFASADGIVLENLATRFMSEVQLPEARCFYGFQIMMENIHSETYSLLIDTYCKDPVEKDRLFRATEHYPSIQQKAQWAQKWMENQERTFAERLVAFACVEGIFFSGSFCSIFWLKKRGKMPGLTFSNELISRDEGLHCDFACLLFSMIKRKPSQETVYDIVREATAVEESFVREALPVRLIGMNADSMTQYIRFTADRLLIAMGFPALWKVPNPFDWMEMISLDQKGNFFERKISEYQLPQKSTDWNYDLNEDF
jgi:ribonucleoside-diphosphate reductase beta chain